MINELLGHVWEVMFRIKQWLTKLPLRRWLDLELAFQRWLTKQCRLCRTPVITAKSSPGSKRTLSLMFKRTASYWWRRKPRTESMEVKTKQLLMKSGLPPNPLFHAISVSGLGSPHKSSLFQWSAEFDCVVNLIWFAMGSKCVRSACLNHTRRKVAYYAKALSLTCSLSRHVWRSSVSLSPKGVRWSEKSTRVWW